jgi:hypothetical protein
MEKEPRQAMACEAMTAEKVRPDGSRLRLWVIGATLIACGFASHKAFDLWVADFTGRIEMGGFAGFEILLFGAGLGLCLLSLLLREKRAGGFRLVLWLSWAVAVFASAWAVLERLPP